MVFSFLLPPIASCLFLCFIALRPPNILLHQHRQQLWNLISLLVVSCEVLRHLDGVKSPPSPGTEHNAWYAKVTQIIVDTFVTILCQAGYLMAVVVTGVMLVCYVEQLVASEREDRGGSSAAEAGGGRENLSPADPDGSGPVSSTEVEGSGQHTTIRSELPEAHEVSSLAIEDHATNEVAFDGHDKATEEYGASTDQVTPTPEHPASADTTLPTHSHADPAANPARKTLKKFLPAECKAIILGEKKLLPGLGLIAPTGEPEGDSDKYVARAKANQRIIKAFGVDNGFTTPEEAKMVAFRARVDKLLSNSEEEWMAIASSARRIINEELTRAPAEINMSELVQMATLKSSIGIMFPDEFDVSGNEHDAAIRQVAMAINAQWLASKGQDNLSEEQAWEFAKQSALIANLQQIFPKSFKLDDPSTNPLNIILPGYETIWRVIFRCFVEVQYRGHEDAEKWRDALRTFCAAPTTTTLTAKDRAAISADFIAKEALRLYSPTRRIYRVYPSIDGGEVEAIADIESVHRNEQFWHPLPLAFRPQRWTGVDISFENNYLFAFGAKPTFRCPAGQRKRRDGTMTFGVAYVALIVGMLCEEVDGEEWEFVGKSLVVGEPMSTDRDAHGDLKLVKKVK